MNEKFQYIEFVFRPNEPTEIAIEASPIDLKNIAEQLEKRLQELGVEPSGRSSEYQKNQYFFFHASRVDMLNALQADGWGLVSSYSINSQERYLYKRLIEPSEVAEKVLFPSDVIKLVNISSTEVANGYLEIGWVLFETEKSQHSEHGYSLTYCLAWSKKNGEPTYPEIKSDSEYTEKIIRDIAAKGTKK